MLHQIVTLLPNLIMPFSLIDASSTSSILLRWALAFSLWLALSIESILKTRSCIYLGFFSMSSFSLVLPSSRCRRCKKVWSFTFSWGVGWFIQFFYSYGCFSEKNSIGIEASSCALFLSDSSSRREWLASTVLILWLIRTLGIPFFVGVQSWNMFLLSFTNGNNYFTAKGMFPIFSVRAHSRSK